MREAVRPSAVKPPVSAETEAAEVSLPGWIYHDRDFSSSKRLRFLGSVEMMLAPAGPRGCDWFNGSYWPAGAPGPTGLTASQLIPRHVNYEKYET
jgi:hypothetical protein